MAKRFHKDSREERVTTYDETYCQDAIVRVVFNFSEPGEEILRKNKIHGNQLLEKIDQGNLVKKQIYSKPLIITTMSNSWRASLQQIIQNWIMTVLGLLKSGKVRATTYDRSGRPDKTSWRMVRQVRPDHEEILLDGTAQSVRCGETLRDRSGRPGNINSQEVANSQNFIMGRDTTELELSVESRSFVNQVNDQVRKRQKNFKRCRRRKKNILLFGQCLWL